MTILLCIFVLLALLSIFANAAWSHLTDKDNGLLQRWIMLLLAWQIDDVAWWKRSLSAVAAFAFSLVSLSFLVFPVLIAIEWAESLQSKTPPFDIHLPEKGAAIGICWMIVAGQIVFRMGYERGRAQQ